MLISQRTQSSPVIQQVFKSTSTLSSTYVSYSFLSVSLKCQFSGMSIKLTICFAYLESTREYDGRKKLYIYFSHLMCNIFPLQIYKKTGPPPLPASKKKSGSLLKYQEGIPLN